MSGPQENPWKKLAALISPPRAHLVRWSGVLSSNSPMRRKILLKPEIKKGFQFRDDKGLGEERRKESGRKAS
jgi:hypothetical protein